MTSVLHYLREKLADQAGATAAEYAIILVALMVSAYLIIILADPRANGNGVVPEVFNQTTNTVGSFGRITNN